jgi:hypothetical protein
MSGNNSDKNNNQENNIGGGNMTVDTDTNNNAMAHEHEAFHQTRLFSGPREINNLVQPLYKLKNASICILESQFRNIISLQERCPERYIANDFD